MRIEKVEIDVKYKYPKQPSNLEVRDRLKTTQEYIYKDRLFKDKRDHGIWFLYFNNGVYAEILNSRDQLSKIRIYNMQGELLNQMRFEDKNISSDHYPIHLPGVLALGIIRKRIVDGEPPVTLTAVQATARRLINNALREDQRIQRSSNFRMYLPEEGEVV